MAGSPLKRQRKRGAVEPATGEVVIIPRLPPVSGRAGKPPGWNQWSPAEKVEHLLGMSFDRMHDYLAWPADQLDMHRLAAQTQVMRVIMMAATKAGTEVHRERERQRTVEDMLRRWNAAEARQRQRTLGGKRRCAGELTPQLLGSVRGIAGSWPAGRRAGHSAKTGIERGWGEKIDLAGLGNRG
jgi:hypothetical protein